MISLQQVNNELFDLSDITRDNVNRLQDNLIQVSSKASTTVQKIAFERFVKYQATSSSYSNQVLNILTDLNIPFAYSPVYSECLPYSSDEMDDDVEALTSIYSTIINLDQVPFDRSATGMAGRLTIGNVNGVPISILAYQSAFPGFEEYGTANPSIFLGYYQENGANGFVLKMSSDGGKLYAKDDGVHVWPTQDIEIDEGRITTVVTDSGELSGTTVEFSLQDLSYDNDITLSNMAAFQDILDSAGINTETSVSELQSIIDRYPQTEAIANITDQIAGKDRLSFVSVLAILGSTIGANKGAEQQGADTFIPYKAASFISNIILPLLRGVLEIAITIVAMIFKTIGYILYIAYQAIKTIISGLVRAKAITEGKVVSLKPLSCWNFPVNTAISRSEDGDLITTPIGEFNASVKQRHQYWELLKSDIYPTFTVYCNDYIDAENKSTNIPPLWMWAVDETGDSLSLPHFKGQLVPNVVMPHFTKHECFPDFTDITNHSGSNTVVMVNTGTSARGAAIADTFRGCEYDDFNLMATYTDEELRRACFKNMCYFLANTMNGYNFDPNYTSNKNVDTAWSIFFGLTGGLRPGAITDVMKGVSNKIWYVNVVDNALSAKDVYDSSNTSNPIVRLHQGAMLYLLGTWFAWENGEWVMQISTPSWEEIQQFATNPCFAYGWRNLWEVYDSEIPDLQQGGLMPWYQATPAGAYGLQNPSAEFPNLKKSQWWAVLFSTVAVATTAVVVVGTMRRGAKNRALKRITKRQALAKKAEEAYAEDPSNANARKLFRQNKRLAKSWNKARNLGLGAYNGKAVPNGMASASVDSSTGALTKIVTASQNIIDNASSSNDTNAALYYSTLYKVLTGKSNN